MIVEGTWEDLRERPKNRVPNSVNSHDSMQPVPGKIFQYLRLIFRNSHDAAILLYFSNLFESSGLTGTIPLRKP